MKQEAHACDVHVTDTAVLLLLNVLPFDSSSGVYTS